MYTIPNLITLLRIGLILPILSLLYFQFTTTAFCLVVFAIFTDFADGEIARRTDSVSFLGAIMDPVADKFFVLALMSFFVFNNFLDTNYFIFSSAREVLQLMAIPTLMGYKKIMFKVRPRLIPKIATTAKFIILAVLFLMLMAPENTILGVALPFLLLLSAIMEVYILVTYAKRFSEIYRGVHDTFE